MPQLRDKIAVVTGGAQGLGQAISRRLANEGCQVVIADVNDVGATAAAAAIAQETGQRAIGMKVDVTQEGEVSALFDLAVREFSRVDVVIANAAILIAEPIVDADAEKWRAVMNVNLFGYFLTTKHACRIMKPQRAGSIININSKSGKKGSAANSAYAASKFGGLGHTQSVALEMASFNVRCNAICPGNLLDSPLWTDPQKGLFVQYLRAGKVPGAKAIEDVRRAYVEQVPMKRGCTYDDVCNAVVFLASDASSYVTGIALSVTGGQENGLTSFNMTDPLIQELLQLSHELGREDRHLAILGEGNTSVRLSDETFLVKASGSCLGTLREDDVTECRFDALLPMLDRASMTDDQIENALMASRVNPKAKKPSVEAMFHAWLLGLAGVKFVGHTHATTVNQILCSPRAPDFAERRMFPDEIVCCGPAAVLILYTDPGLKLAQEMRRQTDAFVQRHQRQPRVLLMQNHGIITLGATWQSVLAAMLMAEKAAQIFTGAAALGGPVFFSDANVQRIAGRPDEAYRQRALKM